MPISDLKQRARNILSTDHMGYVGFVFLAGIFIAVGTGLLSFIPFGGILGSLLISFPISVGLVMLLMRKRATGTGGVEDLFAAYKLNFTNVMFVMFMRHLFIILWTLLLVIPGIIKTYQYSMVPYILAENPNLDYRDALQLSRRMTDGHKLDLFILDLSFIGWAILSAITFGILFIFYVGPYMSLTRLEAFYYLKWLSFGESNPYAELNNTRNQYNQYNQMNNMNNMNNVDNSMNNNMNNNMDNNMENNNNNDIF